MPKKLVRFVICGFLISILFAGCALLPSGRFEPAASAPEQYSGSAAYHYSLSVLARLNSDVAESIDQLQQALAIEPESPYLTAELVSLYVENNNVDLALSLGEATLAKDPGNTELRSIMGGLYFNQRQYDKAIREYKTIIKAEPKNLVAYLYLATIYAQEKKYDAAEKTYRKMLKIDPDNVIGNYYYAKTLVQMNARRRRRVSIKRLWHRGRILRQFGWISPRFTKLKKNMMRPLRRIGLILKSILPGLDSG